MNENRVMTLTSYINDELSRGVRHVPKQLLASNFFFNNSTGVSDFRSDGQVQDWSKRQLQCQHWGKSYFTSLRHYVKTYFTITYRSYSHLFHIAARLKSLRRKNVIFQYNTRGQQLLETRLPLQLTNKSNDFRWWNITIAETRGLIELHTFIATILLWFPNIWACDRQNAIV